MSRGEKPVEGDRFFRTHGPVFERLVYRQRSATERVNSRLKDQLCLKRITIHALLCMITMLLTAMVALRLNRPEKARCITMLAR
jgi:hypothetical protein